METIWKFIICTSLFKKFLFTLRITFALLKLGSVERVLEFMNVLHIPNPTGNFLSNWTAVVFCITRWSIKLVTLTFQGPSILGSTGYPETSVTNYKSTLRKITQNKYLIIFAQCSFLLWITFMSTYGEGRCESGMVPFFLLLGHIPCYILTFMSTYGEERCESGMVPFFLLLGHISCYILTFLLLTNKLTNQLNNSV